MRKALTRLTELAEQGAREGKDFESTDLIAAQALAKLAIESLKLSKTGSLKDAGDGEQKDLFDLSQDPWKLKKVE